MSSQNESGTDIEISAVVVAYNSAGHIVQMIEGLQSSMSRWKAEVIVVDNASIDDSYQLAKGAVHSGQVVRLEENMGYGRGANRGLEVARGRMALILNDDVTIEPRSIELLIDALDSESAARLAAPLMVSPDGDRLPSGRRYLPGLRDEFARVTDRLTGKRTRLAMPDDGPPQQVDFVLAACLMTETEFIVNIGGFTDAFFMYGEDIDLCRRVANVGGYAVIVPTAEGCHDQAVAEDRRIRGRDFSDRILNARDAYYRIWLSRVERMAVNLFRAFGVSDQPHRLRYHLPKAIYDGRSLTQYRTPPALGSSPERSV